MSEGDSQRSSQHDDRTARRASPAFYEWQPALLCWLLAAITFGVYVRVVWFDFVDYDDADYVFANAKVQAGLTWDGVHWAFTTGQSSNWHPITWLSHMLAVACFGPGAAGQHLINVLLHGLNSALLLAVLTRLTGALWRSAFVAGLFALHPLHVESVAWISERKDVLSTLFFLLMLWIYVRYVEASLTRSPSRMWLYGASLALFALGLMSKPMLVTAPFVLLLLDYWPLGRMKLDSENRRLRILSRLLLEKVPFFAFSVASSVVTFLVQKKGGAVSTLVGLPVGARAANALVSYLRYVGKTVWPDDLAVLYPHPGHWPWGWVVAATVFLLGITALAVWSRERVPALLVGWFWFVGTLVPVIGLVQVGIQSMADRYTYVPLIGVFMALTWSAVAVVERWRGFETPLVVMGASLLVICAVVTEKQIGYWRNSETLFRRAVAVTRKNYLAYNNLGFYFSKKGRMTEAMESYRLSLAANPNYEDARNNLGHALAEQKQYAEAIEQYRVALRLKPDQVEVHNNLGNALSETGNLDEAIAHYQFVLARKPDHADAHNNLGIALAMKGRVDEAIPHFQDAIRYKPGYASAHSNLGNAYAVKRQFTAAVAEYDAALKLAPRDAQAHNNLGNVLAELGRLDEAIANYREALNLKAENPEAHFNLGSALARLGRRTEAITHLDQALQLKPDYADARVLLNKLRPAETR